MSSSSSQAVSNPCTVCRDDPSLNISAEDADSDPFVFNFDILERPPMGFRYQQLGCKRWCYSEVSQEEAELCAIMQTIECINDTWQQPQDGSVPPLFFNTAQQCVTLCPDGLGFGVVLRAGTVADRNQAQANRIAFSIACRLARLQRICIGTATPLPSACVDQVYSKTIKASGGTPWRVTLDSVDEVPAECLTDGIGLGSTFPYLWTVITGSLPDGLKLHRCSGVLDGTPTTSGTFTFTVRAMDAIGSFQTKQFTLKVVSITDAAQLPDATVGTAYSHTLTVTPSGTYFFLFASGTPPSWLSLNETTGELSGTPDAVGDFLFEISADAPDGTHCVKEFTLHVNAVTLLAYWTLDESDPTGFGFVNRVDSVNGVNLAPFNVSPSIPGKISNGIRLFSTANPASGKILETPVTSEFAYISQSITLAAWIKVDDKDTANLEELLFTYQFELTSVGGLLGQMAITYNPALDDFGVWLQDDMGIVQLYASATIVTGTWYLVQVIYHADTGLPSIRVDNNPIVNGGSPRTLIPAGFGKFLVQLFPCDGPLLDIKLDECGAWLKALSTAELDDLWNSGNGTTFPNLPQ